ncbi:MAG: Hpt domain-containing protein [Butyricicoccus sp.]
MRTSFSRVNIADLVRYGGDEFVLLSHIRRRNSVRYSNAFGGRVRPKPAYENIHPTVSIGGVYQAHPLVEAIRRADKLMYWASKSATTYRPEEEYIQIWKSFMHRLAAIMRIRCSACNENMVKKFVKKYQDDPTCADLHNAVLQQDWEAAFRGAHTLKGVAQNLGFERLYQVSAVLTEAMRGEKPLEDRSLLDAVEQQDAAIRRAISELE